MGRYVPPKTCMGNNTSINGFNGAARKETSRSNVSGEVIMAKSNDKHLEDIVVDEAATMGGIQDQMGCGNERQILLEAGEGSSIPYGPSPNVILGSNMLADPIKYMSKDNSTQNSGSGCDSPCLLNAHLKPIQKPIKWKRLARGKSINQELGEKSNLDERHQTVLVCVCTFSSSLCLFVFASDERHQSDQTNLTASILLLLLFLSLSPPPTASSSSSCISLTNHHADSSDRSANGSDW
ncbi:hypothetical protein LWI29_018047 [Acer saccharum]|uniref:Uncharacterized protein n=1 Tax=Acer saccharum TaxID=4024 RepID=A0AA39SGH3_ACESA|nr:hypothetical protein LWI29_018047 [Acer saccharum]